MASKYLSDLNATDRAELEQKLLAMQQGLCFICEYKIDYALQKAHLDIDHVQPLARKGPDDPSNFAITHSSCNKSKQAADLRVARLMARFNRIAAAAQEKGRDAPNLDDILGSQQGARFPVSLTVENDRVRYAFPERSGAAGLAVHETELYKDELSELRYFFAKVPIAYLHHDDRINPRGIGASFRGLVEEFFEGLPQLHIALGWVKTAGDRAGEVRVFDGQHKAAAQVMLGVDELPVRVFVDPDLEQLLAANTHAGSTLRQVAFDKSVQRHLGSALYRDRIERFRHETGRPADDFSFSEQQLVGFFSGHAAEMRKYVADAVRDAITHHPENRLRTYIDLGGRAVAKPLSYSTVDKTFYSFFIGKGMLSTPLDYLADTGDNPRALEVEQLVRLMNIVAEQLFEKKFDLEIGTYRLEYKVQHGEQLPPEHLRAYRMAKEENLYVWLSYVGQIVTTFYAMQGAPVTDGQPFQRRFPEQLWSHIANYVHNLAALPLWYNNSLSATVFGGKQTYDFWQAIYSTGKSPQGQQVLAEPLNLIKLSQGS
ncbi:MAG: HNH endonuclease [Dehalococcoidia bacterium]